MQTLVNVTGGHGSLLTSILQANPTMQRILFGVPEVIELAKVAIATSGVRDRLLSVLLKA